MDINVNVTGTIRLELTQAGVEIAAPVKTTKATKPVKEPTKEPEDAPEENDDFISAPPSKKAATRESITAAASALAKANKANRPKILALLKTYTNESGDEVAALQDLQDEDIADFAAKLAKIK